MAVGDTVEFEAQHPNEPRLSSVKLTLLRITKKPLSLSMVGFTQELFDGRKTFRTETFEKSFKVS